MSSRYTINLTIFFYFILLPNNGDGGRSKPELLLWVELTVNLAVGTVEVASMASNTRRHGSHYLPKNIFVIIYLPVRARSQNQKSI